VAVAEPYYEFVTITPKIAEQWLKKNNINRTIREALIVKYAKEMDAGRWTLNNDCICKDPEGVLLNGQHRLLAIIRYGHPIQMAVQFNVPKKSMDNMDSGRVRSVGDVLRFHSEVNVNTLGAAAKLALICIDGRVAVDRKFQVTSSNEIMEFVESFPEIRVSVASASAATKHIDCRPSVLAVGHWLIADRNTVEHADWFLNQLATRENEPNGSAILALDSRFREIRRQRGAYEPRDLLSLVIKGWNYWAKDKRVRTLNVKWRNKKTTDFSLPIVAKWDRAEF
jgi:hypothetical protein